MQLVEYHSLLYFAYAEVIDLIILRSILINTLVKTPNVHCVDPLQ